MSKIYTIESPAKCPFREVNIMSWRGEHICSRRESEMSCEDLLCFPADCPLEDRCDGGRE